MSLGDGEADGEDEVGGKGRDVCVFADGMGFDVNGFGVGEAGFDVGVAWAGMLS